MNELLTLIKGDSSRDVLCGLRSVTRREFYDASARDFYPELVFILRDYLDYEGEQLVEHNGQRYSVLRTYRVGQELELTVARASAEEGGVYE